MEGPEMSSMGEAPESYEALSSEARLTILNALATADMTVAELSKSLHLHPATVRYHIKTLEAAGLVEEASREKGLRSGRPMVRYRMLAGKRIHGYPRRQYEMLSEMFLGRLREALGDEGLMKTLTEIGRESGRKTIEDLARQSHIVEWTPEVFSKAFVEDTLKGMGVIAETAKLDSSLVIFREYSCPFQELAMKFPREMCEAVDEGFSEGICEAMGHGVESAKTKCIGHGDPYCEKAIFWWERAKASAKDEIETLRQIKKKRRPSP